MSRSKAIFLDRDGVINKNIYYDSSGEWESPRTLKEFEFIDGAISSVKRLGDAGFKLFIVTNQPSYAKGKTTLHEIDAILEHCLKELELEGVHITKIYCSYYHPKSIVPEMAVHCKYRKPSPSSLLDASKDFNIDLSQSWMIGDRNTDIECGNKAGVKTIRVSPDYEQEKLPKNPDADFNTLNIISAVDIILENQL